MSNKRELPATMDYSNTENCTGDRDVYCPYTDIFGCNGKKDHDEQKAERENKKPEGSFTFWLIFYEEADLRPEVFTDEEEAKHRYDEISPTLSAVLFKESRRNFKLEGEKWPSDE